VLMLNEEIHSGLFPINSVDNAMAGLESASWGLSGTLLVFLALVKGESNESESLTNLSG
jgi:hypothetical protein